MPKKQSFVILILLFLRRLDNQVWKIYIAIKQMLFIQWFMKFLYPFAKRFIAGPDLKTAIPAIRKIQESGYFTSIDILGESVSTRQQAEDAKIEYLKLCESLDSINHSFDFSIKLSQLGLDIDRKFCIDAEEVIKKSPKAH